MRRWQAVATGVLVGALLTGCGTIAGTDGDLTDDWRGFPDAKPFTPHAGVCHLSAEPTGYLSSYAPLDCEQVHRVETVHVGVFSGADADRISPPPLGSPAMRGAFAECDVKVKQFVGADWRGGRLTVQVVPPSPQGWAGGGRWYRCDMFELDALDGGTARDHPNDHAIERTGTLRDVLTRPTPLAYSCFNEDRWGYLRPVACDKPHRFEYVGILTVPDASYARFETDPNRIHQGCLSVIAAYVNVPDDAKMRYRTGTTFRPPSEEAWERGDRGVRCFLWSSDRDLTRSLKGAGPKALPIG